MGHNKEWRTPRINPGPLLFVVYMNDLPRGVNQLANPVLYADDTSVLVSAKDLEELEEKVNYYTKLHN